MEALESAHEAGPESGRSLAVAPRRRRLVVAEDDVETRCLLAAQLRKRGYEVVEARDGVELLDRLEATATRKELPFDAIISDIYMPGLGGFDVLAALSCARWQTPFILITAHGNQDTYAEARVLGAAAVLEKPFDVGELQAALSTANASG